MFETGTATDYRDLLEKLHTFLTATGSAFGLTYAGTGNGTLTAYKGGASSVAETFTITATSSTSFTVVGSVSGSIGPATVGTPFSHAKVAFLISAGGTAFVAGDVFTLSTAPKWTNDRRFRGATATASLAPNSVENLIDGKRNANDTNRGVSFGSSPALPLTIELTLLDAATVVEYAIGAGTSSSGPKTWTFEYWNGSSWVVLDTRTNEPGFTTTEIRAFTVASPVSATQYRVNISALQTSTALTLTLIELRTVPGGPSVAASQYIWHAPGNDGTAAIYVGARAHRRLDVDYFNWELFGLDGYLSTAMLSEQANAERHLWLPLWNTSIPYWFVVNGRRAIVVAKLGTQYEVAYLGFIESFFTPAQYPYPLALCGSLALASSVVSWSDTNLRYTNATEQHSAPTHSDPNTFITTYGRLNCQTRVRDLTGAWVGFAAKLDDSFTSSSLDSVNAIWPYAGDLSNMDVNADAGYSLFPVLLSTQTPLNWLGQFDGLLAVTGQGAIAETLARVGAVDHLLLPNINRTDRNDWFAVRLD